MTASRVLVLGASGMLGSAVASRLADEGFDVVAAARRLVALPAAASILPMADLAMGDELDRVLTAASAEAVVNCTGLVKQRDAGGDPVAAIAINALLPQRIAASCRQRRIRLIHNSTDCVFSGSPSGTRGSGGYREADPPDATDLYGRSKLLGEVGGPGCLTLRMSLIGREPAGTRQGLVEWFLSAPEPVRGYSGALFTGMTASTAACLIARLLREQPQLHGVWHAAAEPISKLDLLHAIAARVRPSLAIEPIAEPVVDRRLDGTALAARTGWTAPSWPQMLDELFDAQR